MFRLIPHRATTHARTSPGGVHAVFGLVFIIWLGAGCLDDTADVADDAPAFGPGAEGASPENVTVDPVALSFRLGGIYPVNSVFEPARVEVAAMTPLVVTFTNSDLNPMGKHDWALEDLGKTDTVAVGASSSVGIGALGPGEYTYFCSVPTHRDRGMEGTLVVA